MRIRDADQTTPIHKSDASQLFLSGNWCEEQLVTGTPKPPLVFATNVSTADRPEDIAIGPRLTTEAVLMDSSKTPMSSDPLRPAVWSARARAPG